MLTRHRPPTCTLVDSDRSVGLLQQVLYRHQPHAGSGIHRMRSFCRTVVLTLLGPASPAEQWCISPVSDLTPIQNIFESLWIFSNFPFFPNNIISVFIRQSSYDLFLVSASKFVTISAQLHIAPPYFGKKSPLTFWHFPHFRSNFWVFGLIYASLFYVDAAEDQRTLFFSHRPWIQVLESKCYFWNYAMLINISECSRAPQPCSSRTTHDPPTTA